MRKPVFGGFCPGLTQTDLIVTEKGQRLNLRREIILPVLQKTKALISCAVPTQLNCAFVFHMGKIRFSRNAAHLRVCTDVA